MPIFNKNLQFIGMFDHFINNDSIRLEIAILSGRHLYPDIKKGSNCNTFVKVEIIGEKVDTCYGYTRDHWHIT